MHWKQKNVLRMFLECSGECFKNEECSYVVVRAWGIQWCLWSCTLTSLKWGQQDDPVEQGKHPIEWKGKRSNRITEQICHFQHWLIMIISILFIYFIVVVSVGISLCSCYSKKKVDSRERKCGWASKKVK